MSALVGALATSCGGSGAFPIGVDTVAFTSGRSGDFAIFLTNTDRKSAVERLTDNSHPKAWQSGASFQFDPGWSPDGTQIVFASNRSGVWQLYLMREDGSGERLLKTRVSPSLEPAWSPDGTRIAFSGGRGNDLYVMHVAGGHASRLTATTQWAEQKPTWSPDGKRLAFQRAEVTSAGPQAGGDIVVMQVDGGPTRNLTKPLHAGNLYPAWSPDGKWIAFASDRHGPFDLYLVHPDGTGLRRVTATSGAELHPSWSPDSRRLVYGRAEGIFVIGADGRGTRQITDGVDLDPAWRP